MSQISKGRTPVRIPAEVANIVGTSAAILAVVATGSAIVAAVPDPGALAFAVYWWIAQKL
ncbi:hypothetical protein [Phenylobacterium sp. CCH12-B4]|uniref:hypothetical protein n=1 Tax=Phenylobacterium sp. CCH12-B4 TaxID=1768784 RepID=UPI00083B74BA|nr:hypothetical protein [Phenylobacterium sp. CCH12-B4]